MTGLSVTPTLTVSPAATPPLRILQVVGQMSPGGVETWLLHTVRHIDRERFQLDFCLVSGQRGEYASEVEALGSRLFPCPLGRNPLLFGRRFRRLLRGGRYDVVHSHVHHFSGAVLRWACAEGVRVRIAHSHSAHDGKPAAFGRPLYKRVMRRWLERYATHGLAASEEAGAALFGEHGLANKRFQVFYCGIDLEPFRTPLDPAAVRGEFGIPVDSPVVGHVGRFAPMKNHRFLLQIAAEIVRRRPETHFLLVGEGPLRAEIEAQARSLGLQSQMHFAGIRRDVPRLLRGAIDIFLLPSLWEGLPITLIEAQAAGLPCLVSDTVTREVAVLPDNMTYIPVSLGPAAWAEKILERLRQTKRDVIRATRALADSPFSIEHSIESIARIYECSTASGRS